MREMKCTLSFDSFVGAQVINLKPGPVTVERDRALGEHDSLRILRGGGGSQDNTGRSVCAPNDFVYPKDEVVGDWNWEEQAKGGLEEKPKRVMRDRVIRAPRWRPSMCRS